MTGAVGDAKGVDLNSAGQEELDRIGGLGQEPVQRIVENWPFDSWNDLRRIKGFGGTLLDNLSNAGATSAVAETSCLSSVGPGAPSQGA